jgi:hypothetical protein
MLENSQVGKFQQHANNECRVDERLVRHNGGGDAGQASDFAVGGGGVEVRRLVRSARRGGKSRVS